MGNILNLALIIMGGPIVVAADLSIADLSIADLSVADLSVAHLSVVVKSYFKDFILVHRR